MSSLEFYKELETDIKNAYESSVSLEEAEKLSAKFLFAQMQVAQELAKLDLDYKMKKSGVKAIRAAVYMQEATKGEKKPSDAMINSVVDMNKLVIDEHNTMDEAEINKNILENYFSIFKDAHVYFRQISKGRFE